MNASMIKVFRSIFQFMQFLIAEKKVKTDFQYRLSLNAGQKYCRILQGEHSAILSTSIKLLFFIETLVLSIFKWSTRT